MAFLEVLDTIFDLIVALQISELAQKRSEPGNIHGIRQGLKRLRRELTIASEGGAKTAVSIELRLDGLQFRGDVARADQRSDQLWQVVLFLRDIHQRIRFQRIHTPDVQIGDVAHQGRGELDVETGLGARRGCVLDRCEAFGPTVAVIVDCVDALGVSRGEKPGHRNRLWSRAAVSNPHERIVVRAVKRVEVAPIIAYIRPTQVR